jgi:hypothetical protein
MAWIFVKPWLAVLPGHNNTLNVSRAALGAPAKETLIYFYLGQTPAPGAG